MLLCLDAGAVAADLAAGEMACASCRAGRLAPWGMAGNGQSGCAAGAPRGCGRRGRAAGPAAGPASCCRPGARRADGIEVIGAAAGLAMAGAGHRAVATVLAVPAATARGWLRRLRANAGPLRAHAIGELNGLGFYPPGPPSEAAGSPLGDALSALAAAVDCARRNFRTRAADDLAAGRRLGLARFLMPAPAS